jgi:hypothetical protein
MSTYAPGWYPVAYYDLRDPGYLYRAHNARKRLLYVGVSESPVNRFRYGHRHACWFMGIARITITRYPCRVAALVAEGAAIWDECPLWNYDGQYDRARILAPERQRAAERASRRSVSKQDIEAQWDKVWVMISREMNAVCPEGFSERNPSEARRLPPADRGRQFALDPKRVLMVPKKEGSSR